MPSVRNIQDEAFSYCKDLTEAEFGINLESIGIGSFYECRKLQRIVIPLKDGLFPPDMNSSLTPLDPDGDYYRYTQLDDCHNLTTVDIVGAEKIQNTISSLLIESWSDEMKTEFERIKELQRAYHRDHWAALIRRWIRSVIHKMGHYKAEHNRLLKEGMTLLELAVWKAKIDEKEDRSIEEGRCKKAKIDTANARNEERITSGADILIRNVVPFLQLGE